jgi:hypothetical protein
MPVAASRILVAATERGFRIFYGATITTVIGDRLIGTSRWSNAAIDLGEALTFRGRAIEVYARLPEGANAERVFLREVDGKTRAAGR